MKVVLQHPTGNRNVRAVIAGLMEAGMLEEFHTTIAADPKAFWFKLLPQMIRTEFLRRTYSLPSNKIKTKPLVELLRMTLPKIGLNRLVKGGQGWAGIDAVYRSIDRKLAGRLPKLLSNSPLTAVYAYEDGALETFTAAKELGLKCIYDLPIAYWETSRKLMMEEAERLPGWAITLGGGISDTPAKLERKTRELQMADVVVCPSHFVVDSLPSWSRGKNTIMAPFGSPELQHGRNFKNTSDRPLRVLFVGSMSQRKGLRDIFAAFNLLKGMNVELVVMGSPMTALSFYKNEMPQFIYEHGRPHHEVMKLMQTCDIFCLPSIVEGRALVMQEAMSQGLPLIITPNTGGEDLIKEEVTGFLVPIRSPELIAEKINWFLENRSKISDMGKMAQQLAAQYTWNQYQHDIINRLKAFLN